MNRTASTRYGSQLVNWCTLVVGICVVVPPLLRLEKEGWSGPNVFFVVCGILLICFSAARLLLLSWENRQKTDRKRKANP